MSEDPTGLTPDTPAEQPQVEQPQPVTGRPPRARARLPWLLAGVAGLVAICAVTALVVVLAARLGLPNRYQLTIFLRVNATADQKAQVQAALPRLHPIDTVRLKTRDQAWQEFQKLARDTNHPELLNGSSAADMPESFIFTISEPWIDCGKMQPVQYLPGVEDVQIIELAAGRRPAQLLRCP